MSVGLLNYETTNFLSEDSLMKSLMDITDNTFITEDCNIEEVEVFTFLKQTEDKTYFYAPAREKDKNLIIYNKPLFRAEALMELQHNHLTLYYDGDVYLLSPNAMKAFGKLIGMGNAIRCNSKKRDEFVQELFDWIPEQKRSFNMITRKGFGINKIIAFTTERYENIDQDVLIDIIDVIQETDENWLFESASINLDHTYISYEQVSDDADFSYGFELENSDTGEGSLLIRNYIKNNVSNTRIIINEKSFIHSNLPTNDEIIQIFSDECKESLEKSKEFVSTINSSNTLYTSEEAKKSIFEISSSLYENFPKRILNNFLNDVELEIGRMYTYKDILFSLMKFQQYITYSDRGRKIISERAAMKVQEFAR